MVCEKCKFMVQVIFGCRFLAYVFKNFSRLADAYDILSGLGNSQKLKTTNYLSIDILFVISQILPFVKGQTDVFTFLNFMKLSC